MTNAKETNVKEKSADVLNEVKDKAVDLHNEILGYVKENPVKTLSVAALVGLIAGFVSSNKFYSTNNV